MRFATLRTTEGLRAVRIEEDEAFGLDFADVGALLASGPRWRQVAAVGGTTLGSLDAYDLGPLVPLPRKIICVGLNYASHIQEMGRELPAHPTIFAKYARALIGARDPIMLPAVSDKVDWEVELAVVVGQPVRRADEAAARDAIAGSTILNDVSVRDWQFRTNQFLQGKTFESTTPLGPTLVTTDEIDFADGLEVRCEVDGETMQTGNTSDLLFPPVELVRYLSTIFTLDPGDIIATGTPSGVGAGRTPEVYLRSGQTVRTTIEGLGELVNKCVKDEL
ncbi:MAG: fumarylacetoacetate hydrolase family protein [Nocardioidaceae bacterium]|nr:fumarylacetoacetate hydrolase family protein [Nocardioidaceae bacterium]